MMHIAICDDERAYCEKLQNAILTYYKSKNEKVALHLFTDPIEFLNSYQKEYDMLLLDIEMDACSGLVLAEQVRKDGYDGVITFITASEKYAIEGYRVQAYRYLVKPIQFKELTGVLEYAEQMRNKRQKYLALKEGQQSFQIPLNEILYMEMFGHQMKIHKKSEIIELRASLRKVEMQLDETFYKIHKSYCVNLEYVVVFDTDSVTMQNGNILPLSRNYCKEFQRQMARFWGDKIHG